MNSLVAQITRQIKSNGYEQFWSGWVWVQACVCVCVHNWLSKCKSINFPLWKFIFFYLHKVYGERNSSISSRIAFSLRCIPWRGFDKNRKRTKNNLYSPTVVLLNWINMALKTMMLLLLQRIINSSKLLLYWGFGAQQNVQSDETWKFDFFSAWRIRLRVQFYLGAIIFHSSNNVARPFTEISSK